MELKDYLHFYPDCGLQLQDGTIDSLKCVDNGIEYVNFGYGNAQKIHTVKPILRPLSDMTEEEARECILTRYNMHKTLRSAKLIGSKIYWTSKGFVQKGEEDLLNTSAQIFLFLLSKHFDLFDLIPAGLAIDKTKQPA